MNKLILPLIIFLSIPFGIYAQKKRTENFELAIPEQKIPNSLYNSIRFIDARNDTTSVGFILRGMILKEKLILVTRQPLEEQARSVLTALTDSSAKHGELVLHVRQFSLAETTGSLSGKGYCYLRADLFGGNNGSYKRLNKFDSVVVVKAADVTKDLLKTGSEVITRFIAGSLLNEPVETKAFSLDDIYRIDSFEKRDLAIYNTDFYKDGVYRTFRSFIDQIPDGQITAKIKKKEILDIYTFNEKGKKEKVWQKDTYAVIYNGIPYISTEFDYYPLYKKEDDFYFTGKARAAVISEDVIVTAVFFALMGQLLISEGIATFEMKIDHLNGGFIRLKQVKK